MDRVLRNASFVYQNQVIKGDIGIKDGLIEVLGQIDKHDCVESDLRGKFVFPGIVDVHVHFRDPGFLHKETLISGAQACIKGGITTALAMANTNPVMDSPAKIQEFMNRATKLPLSVFTAVAATEALQGREVTDIQNSIRSGAKAVSDDGKPIVNSKILLEIMSKACEAGGPLLCHCEDPYLFEGGALHKCPKVDALNIQGIPREAEEVMVARNAIIAHNNNKSLHICHISSKNSLDLVKYFKDKGTKITAEVAPHHLLLNVDDINDDLSLMKVNPPLRESSDNRALIEGLRDGTIDMVATDHAPHDDLSKGLSLEKAPFGMSSAEVAFPLMVDLLYHKEGFSLQRIVEVCSTKGAELINLRDRGKIEEGLRADLVVFDLDEEWVINREEIVSKGKNCPYLGRKVRGKVLETIFNGQTVYKEAKYDN